MTMTILDKGDYFKVIWEDGQTSTYAKSYDGFRTAEELRGWLLALYLLGY